MNKYILNVEEVCKGCKARMPKGTTNTPACLGNIYVAEEGKENQKMILEFHKVTKTTPKKIFIKTLTYFPKTQTYTNGTIECSKEGFPIRAATEEETKEYEEAKMLNMLKTKL